MFVQTRGFPCLSERVEPMHVEECAATDQTLACPVYPSTSSSKYLVGSCPTSSELDDLLNSSDQQKKMLDTIHNIVVASFDARHYPQHRRGRSL